MANPSVNPSGSIQRTPVRLIGLLLAWFLLGASAGAVTSTKTVLTMTAGGVPTSSVNAKTVITLTATVQAGGAPVSPGQVNFCDASAKLCSDIHLLGTGQLNASGTATIRFSPGPGAHSYRAMFVGTSVVAASSSAVLPLNVSGVVRGVTSTSISSTVNSGSYELTSIVTGSGYAFSPSGTVSYIDTSYGNTLLTTAALLPGSATTGLGFFLSYADPDLTGSRGSDRIAVADLNGDGLLDVATTGIGSPQEPLSVYLGKGDGTMSPGPLVPIPSLIASQLIAVADVNGDGVPDIVISLYDGSLGNATPVNQLQVLLGNGDGTFTLGQTISVENPNSIVTGDFNGDGNADLALAVPDTATASGKIIILLGKGDGTFSVPITSSFAVGISGMAVGDFNRDGKLDIAIAHSVSLTGGAVTILLGNGDGTFTPESQTAPTGYVPDWITSADFNGDGILDLAIANNNAISMSGTPNTINIFLGNGDGTFTSAPDVQAAGTDSTSAIAQFTVGDFNGDGVADLAFLSGIAGQGPRFAVALGNGDGTFAPTQLLMPCGLQYCQGRYVLAAGDFNGDGLTDLASDVAEYATLAIDLAETSLDTSTAQTAAFTLPPGSGTHVVYASYPGDGTFPPSVSGAISLVAPAATSNLTVSATPATVYFGQQVALTAAVTPSVLFGNTPTGRVIFSSGTTPIGKGGSTGNGAFVLDTSTLPVGDNSISATYGGDANFTPSASPPVVVHVAPADFAIAVSPSLLSVVQGGSGSAVVTVTALGSFAQTVQLSCSGLPINSACAFSPATVTVGPTPVSTTMTITTTSHHAALSGMRNPSSLALTLPAGLLGLFALRNRRRPGNRTVLSVLLLLAGFGAALGTLGCGQNVFLIASPTGTSAFTVMASTVITPTISHNATVVLSVMQ